jgi:hypothetical protein
MTTDHSHAHVDREGEDSESLTLELPIHGSLKLTKTDSSQGLVKY